MVVEIVNDRPCAPGSSLPALDVHTTFEDVVGRGSAPCPRFNFEYTGWTLFACT